jgi:hypothetical protein
MRTYLSTGTTWPPLWSNGLSSWLKIQRSGLDSRRYQSFWEVVGLERGPLSLVSTVEELVERKSIGSGLENQDYGRRGSATLTTRHPSIHRSWHQVCGGRSVGIVRSRTKATEFLLKQLCLLPYFSSCFFTGGFVTMDFSSTRASHGPKPVVRPCNTTDTVTRMSPSEE